MTQIFRCTKLLLMKFMIKFFLTRAGLMNTYQGRSHVFLLSSTITLVRPEAALAYPVEVGRGKALATFMYILSDVG
jgi:hypothetical protein